MNTHSDLSRRLGVHTSIIGGIDAAIERAQALGCTTVQIFSHNPRQWTVRSLYPNSVERFKRLRESTGIKPLYVHSSYLINLAAVDEGVLQRSKNLLISEMELADTIGAEYVVLHTGSASRDPSEVARARAIGMLREIIRHKSWQPRLLLENTAGERGDITSQVKDLSQIVDAVDSPLIGGVCIDTCHAFAAGYDISVDEGTAQLADELSHHLAYGSVKLIHLNDSKKGVGSRVDRHQHLGLGAIGVDGLKRFINHPIFRDVPLILETPKKHDDDDPRNLSVARSLVNYPRLR